jgi:vancomycin permeability regulator SanA
MINAGMILTADRYIVTAEEAAHLDADCVLVLGARVFSSGTLSAMLEDRVKVGIALYEAGASPKLLMSGDHGTVEHDEVNNMKAYAVDAGVPPEDVFMDHAGFSTYESMYRAQYILSAKKVVIVTQRYHLFRAVYTARALGIEAYGVGSDLRDYQNAATTPCARPWPAARTFSGRCSARAHYLGDKISLDGSGQATDDSYSNYVYSSDSTEG